MLVFGLLCAAAFVTSIVSGVLGMAGGVALIGVMAALLEAPNVVPLHAVVQAFSNASRTALLWREVAWREAMAFLAPVALGVALGAHLGRGMAFSWLEPTIGGLLVAFVLWRRFGQRARFSHPPLWVYSGVGFAVGLSSLFIGATGPLSAVVFRRDDWSPRQVVATMAVAQTGGHLLKLPAFFALGFDFAPHARLLAALFVCAVAGTWVGRRILDAIPKQRFATLFDGVLVMLGLWLILTGTVARPALVDGQ